MPVRVASPADIGGLVDTILTPALLDGGRAAPVGRRLDPGGRADALRERAGERRPRPAPGRAALHLPLKTPSSRPGPGRIRGLFDLTAACRLVRFDGEGDGLLNVFVPHATAGLVIMELGAGSDADLLEALDDLLPRDGRWRHRHGSRGPRRGPRAAAARAADA